MYVHSLSFFIYFPFAPLYHVLKCMRAMLMYKEFSTSSVFFFVNPIRLTFHSHSHFYHMSHVRENKLLQTSLTDFNCYILSNITTSTLFFYDMNHVFVAVGVDEKRRKKMILIARSHIYACSIQQATTCIHKYIYIVLHG